MNMKTLALASLGLALPLGAFGQASSPSPKVSITSTGADVRYVLRTIFAQAGKAYVLQLDRRDTIELKLEAKPLDEALQIICATSGLSFDVKDGIYYVHRAGAPIKPTEVKKPEIVKTPTVSAPVGSKKPTPTVKAPTSIVKEAKGNPAKVLTKHEPANFGKETRIHFLNVRTNLKPITLASIEPTPKPTPIEFKPLETPSVLPVSVLQKKVSSRSSKAEIRKVFAAFAKQTGVNIEIAPSVPEYRLDTYLTKTSLKYAMDRITEAAGLEYKFTNRNSILVNKPKRATVAIKSD